MVTVLSKINAHDFRTNAKIFGWTHCFNKTRHVCTVPFLFIIFFWKNLFFVFFPEHDYSCFWNPANPSKQKIKTVKPKPYESNPCEKKSNPATDQTDLPNKRKSNPSPISTSPSTTDFPYQTHQTHCRSTHQTHRRSTHPPPPREPDLHRHRTRLSSSWIYILSSSLASLRRRSSSLPFFGGCGTL